MNASLADNTFILLTEGKQQLVFLEGTSGSLRGILTDEAGTIILASQLSALTLTLRLRDTPTLPAGGINSVEDENILNDGVRGVMGNAKAITGGQVNTSLDDYTGRIRLTIATHGYQDGDLIGVRGLTGIRGANGEWAVRVVDANTVELVGTSGSGAYLSGGTAVKGLHLALLPADNAIVQSPAPAVGATEWHEAVIKGTFGSKSVAFLFHFQVKNI